LSSLSSVERWRSSERIAARLLEQLGYHVIDSHRKIVINNTEVGEVDFIAQDPNGETYAVEVKAGRIDVTGVRQAYVNAYIAGMKPLVICKGFADDSARELANALGVKVIPLSDVFLVEDEELEVVLREVVEDVIEEYFSMLLSPPPQLRHDHLRILRTVARCTTISEAAEKLGMNIETLVRKFDEMRSQGVIPKWARRYGSIRRVANFLLVKVEVHEKLAEFIRAAEELKKLSSLVEEAANNLRKLASSAGKAVKVVEKSLQRLEEQVGGAEAEAGDASEELDTGKLEKEGEAQGD